MLDLVALIPDLIILKHDAFLGRSPPSCWLCQSPPDNCGMGLLYCLFHPPFPYLLWYSPFFMGQTLFGSGSVYIFSTVCVTPTLPTPMFLTITYPQVLWFLARLTRSHTSFCATTRLHCMFYPHNPVYASRLAPSVLAFSLSSYRHPYICILFTSRFTSYNKHLCRSLTLWRMTTRSFVSIMLPVCSTLTRTLD